MPWIMITLVLLLGCSDQMLSSHGSEEVNALRAKTSLRMPPPVFDFLSWLGMEWMEENRASLRIAPVVTETGEHATSDTETSRSSVLLLPEQDR